MTTNNLIRFDGVLSENNTFEPLSGWETERVAHRPPTGDGPYVLDLLDEKGDVILAVRPEVDFTKGCVFENGESRGTRVTAYVPHHPEARQLVFRYGARVLSASPVASAPPSVRVKDVSRVAGRRDRYRIRWEAKHPDGLPLTFTVAYQVKSGRGFVVARGVRRRKQVTVDVTDLPGGGGSRFAVLASDGLRSGFDVSKAVTTKPVKSTVFIVRPQGGVKLPQGQPLSLCGSAFESGAALGEDGLVWKIDGKEQARGCLATADGLAPGKHTVTLAYAPGGRVKSEDSVDFEIIGPGKAEKPLAAQIQRIHEAVEVEMELNPDTQVHPMTSPVAVVPSSDCECPE